METSDISINSPGASLVALHGPSPDRWPTRRSSMSQNDLEAMFYGTGPIPVPWATDCPVRFDAWLALAQPPDAEPVRREDLILAINEELGVPQVLERFRTLQMTADCEPIASGSFIAAKLTLRELVQSVLPMTNLYGVIRDGQALAHQQGSTG